jgi:hypothetical protein
MRQASIFGHLEIKKDQLANMLDIYLEIGQKRTFASAIAWPGWCRMGRDEASALQALFAAGPRYARILSAAGMDLILPDDLAAFVIVERLAGTTTTDFGAPDLATSSDTRPIDDAEVQHLQAILLACWNALDVAVAQAEGQQLRSGPRGGGRNAAGIEQHVQDAERAYLTKLGGKVPMANVSPVPHSEVRQAMLETMLASAHGKIAAQGARGGQRWSPRYAARRIAWHVLDHVWEIEDRLQ